MSYDLLQTHFLVFTNHAWQLVQQTWCMTVFSSLRHPKNTHALLTLSPLLFFFSIQKSIFQLPSGVVYFQNILGWKCTIDLFPEQASWLTTLLEYMLCALFWQQFKSESLVASTLKEFTTFIDVQEVDVIPSTLVSGVRMQRLRGRRYPRIHGDTKSCILTKRVMSTWAGAAPFQTHCCHWD